jgi:hypothetical protein
MPGLESALAPFTLKGFYLCTWGAAVGTNVWQTLVCLLFHHFKGGDNAYLFPFLPYLLPSNIC